jgi:chemotaxis protein methyltransferase CheR
MATAGADVAPKRKSRESGLGSREFQRVVELIRERAGIALAPSKRDMVFGRLSRRLRELGLTSFEQYLDLVADPKSVESEQFINALTTNLTSFFREAHHFEFLARQWLPQMLPTGERCLRIWSAGCSTGEEPYSIAMTLLEHLPPGIDFKVLATDLDSEVVTRAERGIYPVERIAGLSDAQRRRWFQRGQGNQEGLARVRPELRQHVTFRCLNLLERWPMSQPFHAIFCRNVVIYFDKDTQRPLFERFADAVIPDGHLFIGHSESLHQVTERFKPLGHTVYQRIR